MKSGYTVPLIITHLIFASPILLRGQIVPHDTTTATTTSPILSMGFERNVNTFLWDLRGSYALAGETWSATATERFQRSLIRSERESIKDEHNLDLRATKRLSEFLSLVTRISSFNFSDSKIAGLNNISSQMLLGGMELQPWPFITFQPLAGYAFDTQQDFLDRGFAYQVGAEMRNLHIGESELSGRGLLSAAFLHPRVQQEHGINGLLFSTFTTNSTNQLQLSYRRTQRDFYLSLDTAVMAFTGASQDIETRHEQIFGGGDALSYLLNDDISIDASVDLVQRRISKNRRIRELSANSQIFDSNIDEFRLNGSGALRYLNPSTQIEILIELNERNESYTIERFAGANPTLFSQQERLEEQKNNAISQTRVSFTASQAFSRSDTISMSGSTVKMVYNTPSSLNHDDRDELFLLGSVRWNHRISANMVAYLAGDVNLRHTVYISSERSANNTWNRVIRLSPGTEYRFGSRFYTKNTADVIANYTVYDFEETNPSQRSFSLRQLIVSDTTSYSFHRFLSLVVQLQVRISERGEFRWGAFTVRPLAWHDERSMTVLFVHPSRWAQVSAGFRFFELTRYRYSGTNRIMENRLRSYGPICRLWFGLSGKASIVADGWYQITAESPGGSRGTPNISLNAVWNL